MRRPIGTGTVYQRRRDGLWVAAVTVGLQPRRRKVVSSATREGVLEKMRALGMEETPAAPPSRPSRMQDARLLGKHTDAEWHALVRRSGKVCPYCEVPLNVFNGTKDHMIPVARGGSDGIENLEYVCWECNMVKCDRTPDEYHYEGPRPREFSPAPTRRISYLRFLRAQGRAS